ncbi:MAG: ABC transporter substrate-binding protein [Candidatus Methylomirabilales bacterium]
MKRIFIASMSLAFVLSLAFTNSAFAAGKTLRIAMILWRGETDAERGFKDGLKELGYSVQFRIWNTAQNRPEVGRLLRNDIKPQLNRFDYIYTFGTTVSKMTRAVVKDQVPQIFTIVVAPVGAGLVQSMESSGGNISGASNVIPLPLQIRTALKITKFGRLGLLFNPREKNSMIVRERLYEISKDFGFEVVDLRSPPAGNMLEGNLQKLIDKSVAVDAIYLPNDSFLLSRAKLIGRQLRAARVKSIAAVKSYIDNGALMGVVADYYKVGKAAARIVDRHQKGERLKYIPIYRDREPKLVINRATLKALNMKVSEGLLKNALFAD